VTARGEQCVTHLVAHRGRAKRRWQRAAAAPEMNAERRRLRCRAGSRGTRSQRNLDCIKDRYHFGKSADCENLADHSV
jgi:hypothetical protein